MYKDPQRQKEANREAQARFKAKKQGITSAEGITEGYPDPVFTALLAKADPMVCRRVSKPGDADYVPMCETTELWEAN